MGAIWEGVLTISIEYILTCGSIASLKGEVASVSVFLLALGLSTRLPLNNKVSES